MAGRKVDPGRERRLLELIASGMSPGRAAGIAGVSVSFAYGLDRKVNGAARMAARREAVGIAGGSGAVRGQMRCLAEEGRLAHQTLVANCRRWRAPA